jgi:hypothetical protein
MYGYEEHIDITPEQLLQKISQEQIFEWLLNEPFKFGKKYKSPFREHSTGKGTCRFEQRPDGTIVFVDFGDDKTHRTCFGMLIDLAPNVHNIQDAIKLILSQFKLSTSTGDYKPISTLPKRIVTDHTGETIITFDKRDIQRRDKLYISQFLILPEHLKEDLVYPTSRFHIQKGNAKRRTTIIHGLCFAIDFIDKVKLYQPYSSDYRFITNCDEDNIGNFDNLEEEGEKLLITKSWKDHRVLRNILFLKNVIWLQNEGMIPSMYILENLSKRFKHIIILFDNDATGVKAAIKLRDIFNQIRSSSCRMVIIPRKNDYKDPASVVKIEGRQDTITILKQIGL